VASERDAVDFSAGVNVGAAFGNIVDWPNKDIVMSRVRWTFGSHPNSNRPIVPGA
jgi:large-conductance mechanosensitive channel